MNDLQQTGVFINDRRIKIGLRTIIADSPARAFVKGVVSFNAAHGCIKCTYIGKKDSHSKRMFFEGVDSEKRIDSLFRSHAYGAHVKTKSPILDLIGCDIIMDII
uniref:Uncharacterized protein n=1 Tax=Anopheles dirus TaxID=7168 RepID=A0A182NVN3_9DIPT